jgi:hypothetical protein
LFHSCHHSFIFVMMYCFRFRSVSRKRLLLFESILDSISKPTLRRGFSKIIAFHFWKISLVSKSNLNLISIRKCILKRNSKSLISKIFVIEILNWISKSFLLRSLKIRKLDFQKDLNLISNFPNPVLIYFIYSLI